MNRFAYATYCDDVRYELNGKTSLIGIYAGKMYVPTFPAHLPKLCVVVTAVTPIDQQFKGFSIKATYNDTTLGEMAVTAEQMEGQTNDEQNGTLQSLSAQMVFSPFAMQEPGKLRVTFTSEGEEIKCNALVVSQPPDGVILQPV